ncbi:MAG: hypothetical protein HC927_06225 [Deltaproteobacteria bacterium]|nr:hypothetical protein [Deltaproteobacteria bacterium]
MRPDCVQFGQDAFAPAGQAPARIKRFEYDRLGRVVLADDPSRGLRVYEYNAFGELLAELDANEQLIEFEYDDLGRLISSTDDEGETTWTWDTKKIGELTSTESSSGVATSYEYDAFTRRTKIAQTIDGETLAMRLVYGDFDRITGVIYPGNPLTGPIALRNLYGADGSLIEVREAKANTLLWQLEQLDAAGNLERERFGNELITDRQWDPLTGRLVHLRTTGAQASPLQDLRYTWNPVGTLAEREDLRLHQREQLGYDHLHRLTDVVIDVGPKHHERQFAYDSLGNLIHASDIGDYDYDHRGRLRFADATQHVWDDNGNLIYRKGPQGTHRFEWTSADKLRRLIPADAEPTEYRYDAEDRRAQRIDHERALETVYLHGFYERDRETKDDGIHETHRYTVYGRERAIAEIVAELSPDEIGAKQTRYLHDDHLGSVDVVTDEQGEVLQRLSYDAWGKPRDPNDWSAHDDFVPELLVNRGYTGHEGRDDAGLVNMGGRLYDPRLGRMINADPFMVDSLSTQGWNRYAYVLNNPLALTDPSGYSPDGEMIYGDEDQTGYFEGGPIITKEGGIYHVRADAPETVGESNEADPAPDVRGTNFASALDSMGLLGQGQETTPDEPEPSVWLSLGSACSTASSIPACPPKSTTRSAWPATCGGCGPRATPRAPIAASSASGWAARHSRPTPTTSPTTRR